jgi:hypothetical protein
MLLYPYIILNVFLGKRIFISSSPSVAVYPCVVIMLAEYRVVLISLFMGVARTYGGGGDLPVLGFLVRIVNTF